MLPPLEKSGSVTNKGSMRSKSEDFLKSSRNVSYLLMVATLLFSRIVCSTFLGLPRAGPDFSQGHSGGLVLGLPNVELGVSGGAIML